MRRLFFGVLLTSLSACASVPTKCPKEHTRDEAGPDECALEAGTLVFNKPVERSLAFQSDQDWYLLPASDLGVYDIATHVLRDGSCGDCEVQLDVLDARGTVIQSGRAFLIAPVRAESLYLRVTSGVEAATAPPRAYSLVVTAREKDDHPNVFEEVDITPDLNARGGIDYSGDTDVLRMAIPAKRALSFEMSQSDASAAIFTMINLPDGTTHDLQHDSPFVFTVQEPTTVELIVQCVTVKACMRPFGPPLSWGLQIVDRGPDEASDDFFLTTLIVDEASGVSGRPYDADWFRIAPMREDHFFKLEVMGNVRALLYELDGQGVAEAPLVFRGQPRERRLLVLGRGAPAGAWSVRLIDQGGDDAPNTLDGARPLELEQPNSGRFEEPGDIDAFVFPALQHHFYRLSADPLALSATVVDGFGLETTEPLPRIIRVNRSGPISLLISGAAPDPFYQLTVNDLGRDENADSIPLELPSDGGQLSAAFQTTTDVDAVTFESSARLVEVSVVATGPVVARVKLLNGVTLQSAGQAGVVFSVRTEQVSSIELSSSAAPMPYTATMRPILDDYDDEVPTPVRSGVAQSGNIEFVGDFDLFSFSLLAAGQFRVNMTLNCAAFSLVRPNGNQEDISDGFTLADGPGRYLLRARGNGCATGSYEFTVTIP